jgi:hypothetical protein
MLKNKILVGSFIATLFFSSAVPANALELDEDTRTVTLDAKGKSVVITQGQVKVGKLYFNNVGVLGHVGGLQKQTLT